MSAAELIASLEIGLIYGIVAIGIYFTFRILDYPDLSCDGSFVTGAATCATVLKAGFSPALGLVLGFLAGGLAGCLTGVLHIFCKVSSLLSGILTAFILYSINLKIMGGVPNLTLFHSATLLQWGHPVVILGLITSLVWFSASYTLITDFGLTLRSIGQNKKLAVVNGVRIPVLTFMALALSNALIGLGGSLFCQHQNFADVSQGIGTIIIGLAAVMIGEKVLPLRSMWMKMLSAIIGSILYRLVVALALHSEFLGLQSSDLNLLTGVIVVLIMMMPRYSTMRSRHA